MNNLKEYITEKLKLNKDSKSEGMFEVGCKCMQINYYEKNAWHMGLDPFCEISPCTVETKNTDKICFKYNNLDGGPDTKFSCENYKEENNILYCINKDKQPVTIIFVDKNTALKILNKLHRHDKWIDFFKIYGNGKEGPKSVPVKSIANMNEFIDNNRVSKYIGYFKTDNE